MLYPPALETVHSLPWTVVLDGGKLYLRASGCTGVVSDATSMACSSCRALHANTLVMGICDRIVNGVKEKTRYVYFAPVHMLEALDRKNRQIDMLKMQALNTATKLITAADRLDGWKLVILAVSQSNTPAWSGLLRWRCTPAMAYAVSLRC